MTNRVEPTFNSVTALDEPSADSAKAKRPTPRPVSQPVVQVSSPLAPLASAALIGLGLVGVVYWQMSVEREQLETRLSGADARILELEQKLTVSGDASEQSLASLGARLKTADAEIEKLNAEIRKLWVVSNERNKKAIDDNKLGIANLAKESENNKKTVSELKKTLDGLDAQAQTLKTLGSELQEMKGDLAVLNEVQESQQSAFAQTRNLPNEFKTLKASLNERISANEEAIKSMDAFRLQVNRQLLQMGGSTAR